MSNITKSEFDKIVSIFEEAGYIPRSYSGRGMYGEKCLGVVCSGSAARLMVDFATAHASSTVDNI